jgi:pyruvate kinase
MMESMITAPRPTRAETNDVANAVMDGADALMLSAETAAGQYPIETIRSMHRTIATVEAEADLYYKPVPLDRADPLFLSASLVASAARLARDTDAVALIGMTRSGYTAFQLARNRPKARIFIFTDSHELLNLLNLVWGIQGFYYDRFNSSDSIISDIKYILMTTGNLSAGDVFVNTGSVPVVEQGPTNFLKVSVA